jgi:hypothetical protein
MNLRSQFVTPLRPMFQHILTLAYYIVVLRDFYRPLGNNNRSIFLYEYFLKNDILACVKKT